MKLLSVICIFIAFFVSAFAGTMQVENLNRGLIAVRSGQGYYLSWRLLANEPYNVGFNVYRGTTKLNTSPIAQGTTTYTDANAAQNSTYTVRAVINGVEQAASESAMIINNTEGANAGYHHINLQRPATGTNGGTYSPNDGSVGDLDGDGIYEIVLKWDPNNSKDNSQSGITDNVFLDAYKLNGTRMWRIDLGPNIRAGAHYTQFLVYDFDGNGSAEIMVKTAPGTKDGTGAFIKMGPAASADHNKIYRNSSGYVLDGPEYITVFNGLTGKELATADYWPTRGTVSSWGDNYGNRVDRFNAAVAYLDGEHPSGVFQRGYYTRMTFAAWDWRNGQLTRRWTFDSNVSGNSNYAGQGNHQLSVADVDNTGKHAIITGSSVIKSDGTGMHRSGWGHGDALHVAHMIKGHPTPQIFMPHESGNVGVSLRQANNGNLVFRVDNSTDIGRGCAAELDASVPGFKFWAASGMGMYDINGNVVGGVPGCNHVIWWDGDLTRALLDGNTITKRGVTNNRNTVLLSATGASSVNGTKSNPVLQADIFGDWREEVIFAYGTNALRIYTSTMPTTRRLVTMMHDPVYRVAIAWQNSSYNQPPHPGYYIASNMDFPPPSLNVAVIGGTTSNRLPTASVTAPADNAVFLPEETINITATASDPDGSIAKVEFFSGTTKLGEKTTAPYTFAWANPPTGVHTITAKATDNSGSSATSAGVSVIVAAHIGAGEFIDNLILFDPTNAAAWAIKNNFGAGVKIFGDRDYVVGASIPAILQSAEWVSTSMETRKLISPATIAQFKMKKKGEVSIMYEDRVSEKPAWLATGGFTASNQKISVNDGTADRTFTVYSKNFNSGETVTLGVNSNEGITSSMMYLIAVNDQVLTMPTASVTVPTNNAVFLPKQTINITATASEPGGSVARVEFFAGTTKLGEKTTAPYTFAWTNPPTGVHTITARVIGNSGLNAASAGVTVIVGTYIGSGNFVDSLILFDPANSAAWAVKESFEGGLKIFGDRDYVNGNTIPEKLKGVEWVSTSMETRKLISPATIAQFKMKKKGEVSIMYEDRVSEKPAWLSTGGFTESSQKISVDDGTENRMFTIYSKNFALGETVSIGINSNNGTTQSMMYLMAITDPSLVSPVIDKLNSTSFSLRPLGGKALFVETNTPTVVDIFDLKGKKVASYNVDVSQILRLSLQSGVYFAKARGMHSIKFVAR